MSCNRHGESDWVRSIGEAVLLENSFNFSRMTTASDLTLPLVQGLRLSRVPSARSSDSEWFSGLCYSSSPQGISGDLPMSEFIVVSIKAK